MKYHLEEQILTELKGKNPSSVHSLPYWSSANSAHVCIKFIYTFKLKNFICSACL